MENKYISEFSIGDEVKCTSGVYEVMEFNYIPGEMGKRQMQSATIKDVETGKEFIASINKNRIFTKVGPDSCDICKYKDFSRKDEHCADCDENASNFVKLN